MSKALSKADAVKWAKADQVIRNGAQAFLDVGRALLQVKENEWYLAEHADWEAYMDSVGLSTEHGRRLMKAFKIAENATPIGGAFPANESVCRALDKVPSGEQQEVFQEATERAVAAGKASPTASDVAGVIADRNSEPWGEDDVVEAVENPFDDGAKYEDVKSEPPTAGELISQAISHLEAGQRAVDSAAEILGKKLGVDVSYDSVIGGIQNALKKVRAWK